MDVKTTRFGTITIPDDRVITFPKGLLGFGSQRNFCSALFRRQPEGSPSGYSHAATGLAPSNHALYLSYPLRRGLSLKPIQRTFHPAATAVDDVRVDHRGRHILVSQ